MKRILFIGLMAGLYFFTFNCPAQDVDTGLVAYYPFDGDALDYSGNGNDGTVVGAVFESYGFGSQTALRFNGNALDSSGRATTYVHVPDAPSLDSQDGLSFLFGALAFRPGVRAVRELCCAKKMAATLVT
jgi:hypothetical protein